MFGENSKAVGSLSHDAKQNDPDIPSLFNENCLLTLIRGLCYRCGIHITEECIRQLHFRDDISLLGFEFVTADIIDIVPVVKHMHQVDMAEGILLSLAAEKRELLCSNESSKEKQLSVSHGVISRLCDLSINRLHRALRAVPDDPKACSALADAYQTLAVAISKQGNEKDAEKAYKMFRNLYVSPFTKCSRTGLSYKGNV